MTLSERGGAAQHGRSPICLDVYRSPLRTDPNCRHLDVGRKPDPELQAVAALPAPRLLSAELRVSGDLEKLVECPLVLARVVGRPACGGVREAIRRNQVAPPQLCRVDAQLD